MGCAAVRMHASGYKRPSPHHLSHASRAIRCIGIKQARTAENIRRLFHAVQDIPVIIQVDQAVGSGLLVRVIDEAKLAGATKVSLATRKKSS